MKFIGDFHIHSHYARATSKDLVPESLAFWARIKGISVVGTGDATHPGWTKELEEKLEPAEPGIFKLKTEYEGKFERKGEPWSSNVQYFQKKDVRFLLTAEISNIYKKNGKVRKVHNTVFAPDFETVQKIQQRLQQLKCNITSDGRPIIGLDSRDLLELCLEASDKIFFVPAHIWTPWFSTLGSKSGFDSIDECFADLTPHIKAVETGLSSDAPMNWMCSFLDKFTLISNSDAHSPEKLGRNANIFETELSYSNMIDAMTTGNPQKFLGTIDLFPQEGKYHFDGHRNCQINWSPLETLKNNGLCSQCGKPVTIGVMNRVAELSDRDNVEDRPNKLPFYSVIPLKELLSEIFEVGTASNKVDAEYFKLISNLGSELEILLDTPIEKIRTHGSEILAEAIRRMRHREVVIEEGYDGEFGKVSVFQKNESKKGKDQEDLFSEKVESRTHEKRGLIDFDLKAYRSLWLQNKGKEPSPAIPIEKKSEQKKTSLYELNDLQKQAAEYAGGSCIVLAGPGTGKTHVLTSRIAYLIHEKKISPEKILAITFTRKAANEMQERLEKRVGKQTAEKINVSTFHAFGYSFLQKRKNDFFVLSENDKISIIRHTLKIEVSSVQDVSQKISQTKEQLLSFEKIKDRVFAQTFQKYQDILAKLDAFDFDDLISETVHTLEENKNLRSVFQKEFDHVLVDEFQDINFSQYQLIRKLMPHKNSNLFVIGDEHQAIYGFRGASKDFIHQFQKEYDPKVFELRSSYRCSNIVLRASGNILGISPLEGMHQGAKIKISEYGSEWSEAEGIARKIEKLIGGVSFFALDTNVADGNNHEDTQSFSDFGVLVRTRQQMKAIEKAFHDHNIPYQSVADIPFFQEEPIRTTINLLRLLENPNNEFFRKKLGHPDILNQSELGTFSDKTVTEKLQKIFDWQMKNDEQKKYSDEKERLLKIAQDFGNNVSDFLSFTLTSLPAEDYISRLERVAVMTMHASKGLEFPCVFIAGCEQGIVPYELNDKKSDSDEERRLLYVGMTRAKKFLYLSHADRRFLNGQELNLPRSTFLSSIEEALIERSREERKEKRKVKLEQPTLF